MTFKGFKYIKLGEYKGKKGNYNVVNLNLKNNFNFLSSNIAEEINGEFKILFKESLKGEKGKRNCLNLENVIQSDFGGISPLFIFSGLSKQNGYGVPYLILHRDSDVDALIKRGNLNEESYYFNIVYSIGEL